MPSVFLSPSTQEYNPYINGMGNEESNMNELTDHLIPYLRANGIEYARNDPSLTVGGSVALSNAGHYDLHLALHSNAAPEALSGRLRGTDVYYYQGRTAAAYFADLIVEHFRHIYPQPELVKSVPTTALYELRNTRHTAVLVEVAYHDNVEDAEWIVNNMEPMARALAAAITDYFGLPFLIPMAPRDATVVTSGGNLNIRNYPSYTANIVGQIPNGGNLTVYGESGEWYSVHYQGRSGFVNSRYVIFNSVLS